MTDLREVPRGPERDAEIGRRRETMVNDLALRIPSIEAYEIATAAILDAYSLGRGSAFLEASEMLADLGKPTEEQFAVIDGIDGSVVRVFGTDGAATELALGMNGEGRERFYVDRILAVVDDEETARHRRGLAGDDQALDAEHEARRS